MSFFIYEVARMREAGSFLPVFFIVGIIKLKNRIVIVTNAIFCLNTIL